MDSEASGDTTVKKASIMEDTEAEAVQSAAEIIANMEEYRAQRAAVSLSFPYTLLIRVEGVQPAPFPGGWCDAGTSARILCSLAVHTHPAPYARHLGEKGIRSFRVSPASARAPLCRSCQLPHGTQHGVWTIPRVVPLAKLRGSHWPREHGGIAWAGAGDQQPRASLYPGTHTATYTRAPP